MKDLDRGLSSIGDPTSRETLDKALQITSAYMSRYLPDRQWFVVGGALRDTDMSRPFKDIDVFIIGKSTDARPADDTDFGDRNAYLYMADEVTYKGIDINLIFMRGEHWSLEQMTDRCDFGICQIGWCPIENRVYKSDDYCFDRSNRVLTQCRDTVPSRLRRMQEKFHWPINNPSGFTLDSGSWQYDSTSGQVVRLRGGDTLDGLSDL